MKDGSEGKMAFKITEFLLKSHWRKRNLIPNLTGQCCDHIFHPEIVIGMDDIEFGIDRLDPLNNVIDGKVVFHQVVDTCFNTAINHSNYCFSYFIDMDE